MKKTLFIVCTHGDEIEPLRIIREVIQEIGESAWSAKADYVVANEHAVDKGVRFNDTDLNRIYPGDLNSSLYEERRAAEILKYAKEFERVVDIHTTVDDTGLFTLVTNNTPKNIELANCLPPKNVVIWESTSGRKTGPITSVIDSACELECSVAKPEYLQELKQVILNIVHTDFSRTEGEDSTKNYYKVFGSISSGDESVNPVDLRSFSSVKYSGRDVYSLLVGVYQDKACYVMEKVTV